MKTRNQRIVNSPIIGRATQLYRFVHQKRNNMPSALKYTIGDEMLKKCQFLHLCAFRQLKGHDYRKRALEVCEELQALAYLAYDLGGMNRHDTAVMDVDIDAIIEQVERISRNAPEPSQVMNKKVKA